MSNWNHWRCDIINDLKHNHRYHSVAHHEEWYYINMIYFLSIHFVSSSMFPNKNQGQITNDTFMEIVILFQFISTSSASWSILNSIRISLLSVSETQDDNRRSVELIVQVTTKIWEVIWIIRFCEQISFIRYTYWETQRTLCRWWWISERSRINFEQSPMIENVAWRWFEDNVFEYLICWSYIFTKYI